MSSSPTRACPPAGAATLSTPDLTQQQVHWRAEAARHLVYKSSATTPAQWALIAPLLPAPGNTAGRGGRPEKWPRRLIVDAVFYLVHGGIPWAELPREFPPPSTVWTIFTRWVRTGVWAAVHDALVALVRLHLGRTPLPSAASIDSQSVRAGDTVPAASRGYDGGKKVNGRKRHIAVDTEGLVLAVLVTVAGIQDRDGGLRLLALLALLRQRYSTVVHVWADSGYAGRLVVFAARVWRLTVQVVRKLDDQVGFVVLHRRWVVERTFAWISKHRRCVRDYETRTDTSEAMVHIAMIMTMSRRLARQR